MLISFLVAAMALSAPGSVNPVAPSCDFSIVRRETRPPEIIGLPETAARTRVLSQPDSPLLVRRVDVSRLRLDLNGDWYHAAGSSTVDVENVSDRVVTHAVVMLLDWRWPHLAGGPGQNLESPLPPGATRRLIITNVESTIQRPDLNPEGSMVLLLVVESIRLDGCDYRPARALSRITGPGMFAISGCGFSTRPAPASPEIVGPPEIVAASRVLLQPDSPLAVRRADLSGLRLYTGGGVLDADGPFSIDVENVSDRTVRDATISLRFWAGSAGGGHGPKLRQPLAPGEVTRLLVPGGKHHATFDPADGVELVFVVDRADLDECVYYPAVARPRK